MSYYSNLEKNLGNGYRPYRYRVEVSFPNGSTSFDSGLFSGDIVNTLVKATTVPGVRIQQRNFYGKGGHIIPIVGTKVYEQEWNATFYLDDDFKIRNALERWVHAIDSFASGMPKQNQSITDSILNGVTSKIENLVASELPKLGSLFKDALSSDSSAPTGDQPSAMDVVQGMGNSLAENVSSFAQSATNFAKQVFSGTKYQGVDTNRFYGQVKIIPMDISDNNPIYTYVLHNVFPIYVQPITLDDSMTNNIAEFNCSFAFSHFTIEPQDTLVGGLAKKLGLDKAFG